MVDGIVTLGNDYVFDQIIALINSIEAIAGVDMPVCIYPYDGRTEKLAAAIADKRQVKLYSNPESMARWDGFAAAAWDSDFKARKIWQQAGSSGYHRFGTHRRYCAFDGPFDRFLYMDADTLLMSPVDRIFQQLDTHDCVVYDFQHKDPSHVYNLNSSRLKDLFGNRINREIFCSGFYASKRNLFSAQERDWLVSELRATDAEVLYPMAPDQTLINYMMMKSGRSIYNFALQLPTEQKTGCCATSPHFQEKNHVLYDGDQRLTYIHYIGLSSRLFAEVSQGKNIDFPYRDLFLHYRFLDQPEAKPQFSTAGKPYNQPPSLARRVMRRIGLKI